MNLRSWCTLTSPLKKDWHSLTTFRRSSALLRCGKLRFIELYSLRITSGFSSPWSISCGRSPQLANSSKLSSYWLMRVWS